MKQDGIALVLGGGGMFGAYEAGLWQGLEGHFRPDHIFGASVGAFNAWAIAGGFPAEELARLWLDFPEARDAQFRFPWPPWSGCIDMHLFDSYLRGHHARFTPQIPTTITLTRLWPLEDATVTTPHITWQHLAASCSVPLIMTPKRINGSWYADGGLFAAVPVWAAERAGFRRMVAVSILPRNAPLLLRASWRFLRLFKRRPPAPASDALAAHDPVSAAARPTTLWVSPSRSLGPVRHSTRWEAARIREWVEIGRSDAPALLERIRSLDQ